MSWLFGAQPRPLQLKSRSFSKVGGGAVAPVARAAAAASSTRALDSRFMMDFPSVTVGRPAGGNRWQRLRLQLPRREPFASLSRVFRAARGSTAEISDAGADFSGWIPEALRPGDGSL